MSCGQCIGCRTEQKRQWGVRGMHELATAKDDAASFITLTYADEELPEHGNLQKSDWTLFAKKLRHKMGPFRFLMCGEYGSRTHTERCHMHAIIYNHDFTKDRVPLKKNEQGQQLYRSKTLEDVWTQGISSIGSVSFDSVSYVASYIQKRVIGKNKDAYYRRINKDTGEEYEQVPEFALMSRGDNSKDLRTGYGLGHAWIVTHHKEVYPRDEVLVNGVLAQPPAYYDRWYAENHPITWKQVQRKREIKARVHELNNSPERLAVRKKVFTAKANQY